MERLTKQETSIILDALNRYHFQCLMGNAPKNNPRPKPPIEDIEQTIELIKQKLDLQTFTVGTKITHTWTGDRYMIVCSEPNKVVLINTRTGCFCREARYVDDPNKITLRQLSMICNVEEFKLS